MITAVSKIVIATYP